ncbi:hypothetical protein BST61_g8438 [Cercospora zeina]
MITTYPTPLWPSPPPFTPKDLAESVLTSLKTAVEAHLTKALRRAKLAQQATAGRDDSSEDDEDFLSRDRPTYPERNIIPPPDSMMELSPHVPPCHPPPQREFLRVLSEAQG